MKKCILILAAIAAISIVSAKTLTVEVFDAKNEKVVIHQKLLLPADGTEVVFRDVTEVPFKGPKTFATVDGKQVTQTEIVQFGFGTIITAKIGNDGKVAVDFQNKKMLSVKKFNDDKIEIPSFSVSTYKGVVVNDTLSVDRIPVDFGRATFKVSE